MSARSPGRWWRERRCLPQPPQSDSLFRVPLRHLQARASPLRRSASTVRPPSARTTCCRAWLPAPPTHRPRLAALRCVLPLTTAASSLVHSGRPPLKKPKVTLSALTLHAVASTPLCRPTPCWASLDLVSWLDVSVQADSQGGWVIASLGFWASTSCGLRPCMHVCLVAS